MTLSQETRWAYYTNPEPRRESALKEEGTLKVIACAHTP